MKAEGRKDWSAALNSLLFESRMKLNGKAGEPQLLSRAVFPSGPCVGETPVCLRRPQHMKAGKGATAAFVTPAPGRQNFALVKSAYAYTLCLHPTVIFAHK
jgi:hypothetical protein